MGFLADEFYAPTSPHDWLKEGCFCPRSHGFLASIWWIWRHRNLMILNNETWSPVRLSFNILSVVETLNASFPAAANSVAHDRYVKWNNNNHPGTILNVDSSVLGTTPRTGFGCILRNDGGLFLAGVSGFIPDSSDILLAELRAIYHGLLLANNMGFTELTCYTDSLTCIGLIHGEASPYHVYAVLIRSIKDLLSQSTVTLCHTLREGNQCADFLAKRGACSNDQLKIHTSPPDGLLTLLHADASGTLFLRD
jgi:ribonuclease HI